MLHRRLALLAASLLLVSGCSGGGGGYATPGGATPGGATPAATAGTVATGTPVASAAETTSAPSTAPASTSPASAPATTAGGSASAAIASGTPSASVDPKDLLAVIKQRGEIRVSTDPNYPPQSFLKPDGTFAGFDIDVANEIAKRLGVKVKYETPAFELITAGNWAGRWDMSVGSVTVTPERLKVLDFTQPYYYTPAQMAVRKDSGITTLEGLAGKTVCVGAGTTYFDWLNGKLDLGPAAPPSAPAPAGVKVTTFPTDKDCVDSITSGRSDFEGFLSSSTTVADQIKNGAPLVTVGDPVFLEPLAIATDKEGPPHAALAAELDRIVGEMHTDGTLSTLSKKWFGGLDLTQSR